MYGILKEGFYGILIEELLGLVKGGWTKAHVGGCQHDGVPFWVLSIIRHLYLCDPKGEHNLRTTHVKSQSGHGESLVAAPAEGLHREAASADKVAAGTGFCRCSVYCYRSLYWGGRMTTQVPIQIASVLGTA